MTGGGWTAGNRPEPSRADGRGRSPRTTGTAPRRPPRPSHRPPHTHTPPPPPSRRGRRGRTRGGRAAGGGTAPSGPFPAPHQDDATAPRRRRPQVGGPGAPVAESALAPPGPIPNPVVTQRSAGEYCGGDPTGGEAAAGAPGPRDTAGGPGHRDPSTRNQDGTARPPRGGAAAARWAHNPKVGGSNPPPATTSFSYETPAGLVPAGVSAFFVHWSRPLSLTPLREARTVERLVANFLRRSPHNRPHFLLHGVDHPHMGGIQPSTRRLFSWHNKVGFRPSTSDSLPLES